jgi:hypothetical protein
MQELEVAGLIWASLKMSPKGASRWAGKLWNYRNHRRLAGFCRTQRSFLPDADERLTY